MVLAAGQGVDGVVALTIGMATYNDFNGVYFTLQALRLYQDLQDTDLLVIDNYGCQATKELVEGWVHGARYLLAKEVRGTAAPRDLVFREARGEAVLCCDSHVLFAPGAIRRLKEYYREHPDCPDLLQGPLVYDDLETISTHFEPVWRAEMWGTWATDPRGQDPEGEQFEIPMQGLGAFSCRKAAWPGFNSTFRGFGGEEGYIHEKFRQAGGRCLCLPWLRWTHRFGRPAGTEYPLTVEEKLRNYLIGHAELGLDPTPVLAHFSEILPEDHVVAVAAEALEGPPQAREPTAATPPEVNAGAAGGGAVPLSEGAGQGLPSPLVLASPRRERNNGVELLSGEEHKAMSQEAAYYTPDYFSQIEEGSLASARVMVPILLKLVEVQSVIDIGCGTGAWLSVFRENGIEDIWGVDGPYINRNQLKIPAQQFTSTDLEQPFHMPRNFDLVVALEVAEHLSEGSAETLVNTLTGLGPVVLFSAAIPNQGGANHQNEQWPEYWAKLFNSNGYVASDAIRRRVWTNENVEVWYAQNTLLFVAQEQLQNYPLLRKEYAAYPPSIVHPKLFLAKVEQANRAEAVAVEALGGPQAREEPQAREPTATTPHEVDAGAAGGGATAPATLTEGADQVLQSPLLKRLPSPLQGLSLIVLGPARIGRMARGVGRFAHGARNPVEEFKAEPTAMVDHPQPQAPEPTAATPPEVNAGAAGGGAVPLSEGAGQGLPSPLVLASPRRERNNGVELLSGEEHKAMSQEAAYYPPDYFSQIEEGSLASARVMVPILLKLVEVQSVIDIGCGTGAWLSVFRENGIEDIWGVDGPYINRNQLKIPAQQFTSTDLEQPFHMPRNFDLVVALEVAEHLSEGSAETLVNTLTGLGPVVLFSAAIPNQGGANHQNEQWPEYWAKLFNSNGYVASDAIRRRVWTNENVQVWYAQNTLLFVAQEQLQNYPLLRKEYAAYPPSIVHPKLFLAKVEQANRAEAVAAEALGGPQAREEPQAPEPTATTPHEVDAGAAGGGATAPATLTEGADQVLQSPLLKRLPSPLQALSLIVFGPARIGRMARGVGRFAHGARNPVEEFKAEPTAMVDHPQRLPNPPQRQKDLTATRPPTMTSPSDRRVPTAIGDRASRRAIVCFVEDDRRLIQQVLALRHSWLYARSPDTDLVVMGPADVLASLPDDLVKIEQQPAADDPVWRGYRYANLIACLNGAGAERLDRYTHILRTDVDTFITPAWNDFHPTSFMVGNGAYSNDDEVRQRIQDIAVRYGLVHRGLTNVGPTWYGPTEVVRRAGAFAEMLTKHILTHHFSDHAGEWPGWYRGVPLRYAGEIAVNHCAPDAQRSELLDASSSSQEPLSHYAHIHCWHTYDKFSKHHFMSGRYTPEDAQDLDLHVVRDYCMALSFRSLGDLKALQGVERQASA